MAGKPGRSGGPRLKTRPDDRRGAPKGSQGQPPFEPTDEQRQIVRTWGVAAGEHFTANRLGISVSTLIQHFRKELDDSLGDAIAQVGGVLLKAALRGENWAVKMFLTMRSNGLYAKTTRFEHTGADGGPIAFDLSGFTMDEKKALLPLIDRLLTQAGEDLEDEDGDGPRTLN